ncbi:MAG: alpha/beta hydrolase [Actinomycetota bacterium]
MSDALDISLALDPTPPPSWFTDALAVPEAVDRVEVDGCEINYIERGGRDAPHVLLLHGFLAHARCFDMVAPLLVDDLHVVAMDMSGMGDSGHRAGGYQREQRVAEVLAVAEATGMTDSPHPWFLVTHSYGSTVGIDLFEAHPDAAAGFAVCDLMFLPPAQLREHMEESGNRLSEREPRPHQVRPDLETALSRYRLAPPQPCENPWAVRHIGFHSLREVEGGYIWKFDPGVASGDRREPDWWVQLGPRFASLDVRRAIVHGADSLLFTPEAAEYVRDLAGPEVPIIAVPHAHHHLMLDQPVAFASVVRTIVSSWVAADAA